MDSERRKQMMKESAARHRERKRLESEGLPIPEWLEKRKTRVPDNPDETPEEKRQRKAFYVAQYKRRHPDRVAGGVRVRRQRARDFVHEIKKGPCMDCGGIFPDICMQFDHRPGEEKIYGSSGGVARLVATGSGLERIQEEIDKCDLVCSNCHWIRTHERNGWYENE